MKILRNTKLIIFLVITTLSMNIFAADSIGKQKLKTIQHQISELENLIQLVGINRISNRYLNRANETRILLNQIKAEPRLSKINAKKVNSLYLQLDKLLFPDRTKVKKASSDNKSNPNGTISGIVTTGITGEPLYGIQVKLYDNNGNFITEVLSGNNGRYYFRELIAGSYYVVANRDGSNAINYNYITTSYPSIICEMGLSNGCQIEDLMPIHLSENQTLTSIDIEMIFEAIITGKIHQSNNANSNISQAQIKLFNLNGELVSEVYSSNSSEYYGSYLIAAPPGEYYMTVEHSSYYSQLFENITCNDICQLNLGSQISMNYNQPIENFNFGMELLATSTMSGYLVDKETQQIIPNGTVYLYNSDNQLVATRNINSEGFWQYFSLPIGEYKIASTVDDYLATIYDSVGCDSIDINSCDFTNGLLISHNVNGTENILLQQLTGTSISGRVLDALNQPILSVELKLYNANYEFIKTSIYNSGIQTDANGYYVIPNVGLGPYFLLADAYVNYQDELYPNTTCTNGQCDFTLDNLLQINNVNPLENINFNLSESTGEISGKVTDANLNPLNQSSVYARQIFNTTNLEKYSTYSDQNGNYHFENLPIGSYQVYAGRSRNNVLENYLLQSYLNIQCENSGCYGDSYTPVFIDNSHSENIDFKLLRKGIVNFNLTSTSSNSITEFDGKIKVLDSNGYPVYLGSTNFYRTVYLTTGDYYFIYNDGNFVSKIYGGENCNPHCNILNAELVHVENGTEQTLNMNLDEYYYLELDTFNVVPERTYIYDENSTNSISSINNNNTKIHIRDTSNKKIKFAANGYFDQLFNGINCINNECSLSDAEVITPVINSSRLIDLNMLELLNSSISGFITDTGPIFEGNRVELHTSLLNSSTPVMSINNVQGAYTFSDVPSGNYYIKVYKFPTNQGATTYYGNIACEKDCDHLSIPSINITQDQIIENIDILVTTKGTISGEGILDLNNQAYNTLIKIYNEDNEIVHSEFLRDDDNGMLSPIYLSQGSYKLILHVTNRLDTVSKTAYPSTNCEDLSDIDCLEFSETIEISNGLNSHFNDFIILLSGEGLQPSIGGVISNSTTGELVDEAVIYFYHNDEIVPYETTSNANGEFRKILPNGSYYIMASGNESNNKFNSQLHANIECTRGLGVDCILSQGEIVEIDNRGVIANVNFSLLPKPKLKINVVNEFSGDSIGSSVAIYDSEFRKVDITSHSYNYEYHLIENLNANQNYFLLVKGTGNYQTTGYPDIYCEDFNSLQSCDGELTPLNLSPTLLQEITVKSLLIGGINGYVKDDNTGLGIEDIIIDVWSENGFLEGSVITSTSGMFSYVPHVSNISYYLSTDTNNNYKNEVYNDVQCENAAILGLCDVQLGELIFKPYINTVPIIINIGLNDDILFSSGFDGN